MESPEIWIPVSPLPLSWVSWKSHFTLKSSFAHLPQRAEGREVPEHILAVLSVQLTLL
jgi:hypothetical protein